MIIRRIVQFGTKINDLITFRHDHFQNDWEDNWGDEVDINSLELQFADGSFRNLGFDQSRKTTKTITKKFSINLSDTTTSARYHDHIHRVLRGGVKKLIAEREDGSLMWTWAEAKTVGYSKNSTGEIQQQSYTVDFVAHIPYWYSYRNGQVGYMYTNNLEAYFTLCNNIFSSSSEYQTTRTPSELCPNCYEFIIEDGRYGVSNGCTQGCVDDRQILKQFGVLSIPATSTYCAESSAGYGIDITFFNSWTNPTVIFGGQTLSYTGTLLDGEYLHLSTIGYNSNSSSLYLDSSQTIDKTQLSLSGTQLYGTNTISFTGNNTNGLVAYNIINRYHN